MVFNWFKGLFCVFLGFGVTTHYRIHSIVLRTKDTTTSIITAMHNINKARENSHVKTNLVHILHQMRKVGTLEYTEFKGLLTDDKFEAAKKHFKNNKENCPWYCLPRANFLEYIYSVSILHRLESRLARALWFIFWIVKSNLSRRSLSVSISSMILLRLEMTPSVGMKRRHVWSLDLPLVCELL